MPSVARAFYKLDNDLRFLSANQVALSYWGRTAAEVIGRTLVEAFPQAVGTAPFRAHQLALRSLRPYRGRLSSPVLGSEIDLEIHPHSDGLDVSFVLVPELATATA